MKKTGISGKRMLAVLLSLIFLFAAGCGEDGGQPADAEALVREARTNANAIANCTATLTNSLNYSVDGRAVVQQTASSQTYFSTPYRMKSTQSAQLDGVSENTLSYTITEEDGVWFYSKSGDEPWQKTRVQAMGTTPLEQVDILRLLPNITGQKYVRSTTVNGRKVHKVELTFQSAAVRSMLETIVTSSGIASGSQTIVPALLESAPEVYGYCYIAEDDAQIVRLELDATEALNTIFQKIDGASIAVSVSKAVISGDLSNIGKAETVELPDEAKSAQESNAVG